MCGQVVGRLLDWTDVAGRRRVSELDVEGQRDAVARSDRSDLVSAIGIERDELAGSISYSEVELLEKWARDSKILDIFEGTQQI